MKQPFTDPLAALRENPSSNMSDKLFEKMRGLIVSGTLPPGYAFPNENTLCEQLSVGRSTLREAYKALAACGFITRTKAGTVVNDTDTIVTTAPLGVAMELCDPMDLAEFRLMLEMENARFAAMRATPLDLEEMETILRQSGDCGGDITQLARYDIRFHMQIAQASHNVLLRNAMMTSADVYETGVSRNYYRLMRREPAVIDNSLDQHAGLLRAIRDGNSSQARRLMREHIQCVYGITQAESEPKIQKEVIP